MGADLDVAEKQCSKCKRVLSVTAFWRNRQMKDGRDHYCAECRLPYARAKYAKSKERRQAEARQRRVTWAEQSRCTRCGRPQDRPGRKTCQACDNKDELQHRPYRKFAGPCAICGFEQSDVHHLDRDYSNLHPSNFVCLCPNHHRLLHLGLLSEMDQQKMQEALT